MEKYVFVVLCGILALAAAPPPKITKQYRNDYVYNRKTDAFYKLHIEKVRRWHVTRLCETEGAQLMIPASDHDMIQLHAMFKQFPDLGEYVWVGDDGHMHESAEEQPIIDLTPPNGYDVDVDQMGRCDVGTRSGDIETTMCFREMPFICKVAAKDASYDEHCGVYGKSYRYYPSAGSCYKIPRVPFTWSQAYSECQAEGAHLLVVNSQAEHDAIFNLTNTEEKVRGSRTSYFFFAGFRADKPVGNATLVFKTIFMTPPNGYDVDVDQMGRCDVGTRSGDIETTMCFREMPFICKVAAKDASYDEHCGVYGKSYRYYPSAGSCYKIPRVPFTWSQAYSECQAEGAHLLVVNSQAEHDAIFNLTNTEEKVRGSRTSYFFFAGFRADKPVGNATLVFKTIFNQTLEEAGYSSWSENEPNNALGREFCGSIFSNDGKLNDVDCSHEYAFICEKEIPASS